MHAADELSRKQISPFLWNTVAQTIIAREHNAKARRQGRIVYLYKTNLASPMEEQKPDFVFFIIINCCI
ncbi:unnamed protein product [Allacma fusca]|uniref:Uncharacterized protein n=1 Tax=Allacma fusca TaxID=39272 RepID=A0A8J2KER8_9HEXA|nr:unnamed protein product [Allacma fusca]